MSMPFKITHKNAFLATNDISLVTQCNEVESNNVTRDSVIQISISVMLKRDFGRNRSI